MIKLYTSPSKILSTYATCFLNQSSRSKFSITVSLEKKMKLSITLYIYINFVQTKFQEINISIYQIKNRTVHIIYIKTI